MDEQRDLTPLILAHVGRPEYRPVKSRAIARQLELPREQYAHVTEVVKRLVSQGRLAFGEGRRIEPASRRRNNDRAARNRHGQRAVTGVFRRTSAGYGFVRPQGAAPRTRQNDIYVPLRQSGDASSGDLVIVRVDPRRGPMGRLRGAIVEVLERDTHRFVGTYHERARQGYVMADAGVFAQPILVGDAGAKAAKSGDKVVVEMVRFPSHLAQGEGVIVEVLGPRGAPGVDTLSIIREFGLPDAFPDDVLESARKQAEKFDEKISGGRVDRTGETIITIDPVDARDFDDAISLVRLEDDYWLLGVHIADVTHFVPPHSPLDREARERGTSVYLPDRVIPMLPETISNNLASLQPDRVRYAKSALIELSPDGVRTAVRVERTAIRSRRRFTYEEVDDYLAGPDRWKIRLSPEVFDLLGRMHELAMVLRRRRLERGAIELTLPEVKIDLDGDGRVSGAHVVENTVSHQIIEEFMLCANEAVAEHLDGERIAFLRRIHEAPDPAKLELLTEFVRELGIPCDSLVSRFEIKRVLALVADKPQRHAVNYAVLRSMQKAVYSPEVEGHYALHSRHYCHFTSPIRRYPDLTVHRIFDALARGKRPTVDILELGVLGEHCSEREQRAEQAERELIKLKLLNFLATQIGREMDAVITGVEDFGLFAQGLELPAEGFLHISTLPEDSYDYDDAAHLLRGKRAGNSFRLGDVVRVAIQHVDPDRRELDFRLAAEGRPALVTPTRGGAAAVRKRHKPQRGGRRQEGVRAKKVAPGRAKGRGKTAGTQPRGRTPRRKK